MRISLKDFRHFPLIANLHLQTQQMDCFVCFFFNDPCSTGPMFTHTTITNTSPTKYMNYAWLCLSAAAWLPTSKCAFDIEGGWRLMSVMLIYTAFQNHHPYALWGMNAERVRALITFIWCAQICTIWITRSHSMWNLLYGVCNKLFYSGCFFVVA